MSEETNNNYFSESMLYQRYLIGRTNVLYNNLEKNKIVMNKNDQIKNTGTESLPIKEILKSNDRDLRTTFELPQLEGDTQIYLGQTIVTLMRLAVENDTCYSKDMQRYFKTEIMASVLEELDISLDDIAKVYQERKNIDD